MNPQDLISKSYNRGAIGFRAFDDFPSLQVATTKPRRREAARIDLKQPFPVMLTLGTPNELDKTVAVQQFAPGNFAPIGPVGTGRVAIAAPPPPLLDVGLIGAYVEYETQGVIRARVMDFHSGTYQLPPVSWAKVDILSACETNSPGSVRSITEVAAMFSPGHIASPARATVTDIFAGDRTLRPPAGGRWVRMAVNEAALPGTMAVRMRGFNETIQIIDHVNGNYWPPHTPVEFSRSLAANAAGVGQHTVAVLAGAPTITVEYLLEF